MKCNDCKFADRNHSGSEHGTCQIKLPAWLQKREGDNGRHIWLNEYSDDGCDLGVAKEVKEV